MAYRSFQPDDPLPANWTRAIEEFIATMASANFRVIANSTDGVQVVASTGDDQVSIGIDGSPRWIDSTIAATHPGGAAGTHDVWVCSEEDSFSPDGDGNEQDDTDHDFTLKIKTAPSGSGSEALSRKVATVVWSGTAITQINQLVGNQAGTIPSGPAGGDLGGTFPNPTVVTIDGVAVSAVIMEGDSRLTDTRTPTDNTVSAAKIQALAITNAKISATAAIARSKLDFGSGLVNADIATGAAIAKAKLAALAIVNADVDGAAAIARSKLNFGSGLVDADIASGAAIAESKLALTNRFINDVYANRPAAGTAGRFFRSADYGHIWYDDGTVWRLVGGVLPAARRMQSGASSHTNTGDLQKVPLNTAKIDVGHVGTSMQVTDGLRAPITGIYRVAGACVFEAGGTAGDMGLEIAVNDWGDDTLNGSGDLLASKDYQRGIGAQQGLQIEGLLSLTAGQVVSMFAEQSSGGNRTYRDDRSHLSLSWVGHAS